MSKADTQYFENEREITGLNMSRFGLNPFACDILIKSYLKNVSPKPVSIDYYVDIPTGIGQEIDRHLVKVELRKPGYVGMGKGDAKLLDEFGLRLFARSYFEDVRPRPVSFLYMGIEVHLRTPGVAESKYKNIARDIYNPTK